jgi:hypothetical protein
MLRALDPAAGRRQPRPAQNKSRNFTGLVGTVCAKRLAIESRNALSNVVPRNRRRIAIQHIHSVRDLRTT